MASTPPSSFPTVEPPLAEQPAWHPSSDAPFHRGVQVVGQDERVVMASKVVESVVEVSDTTSVA